MAEEIVQVGKYTLESLTTGMYSYPKIVYREYIQNSVDSLEHAVSLGKGWGSLFKAKYSLIVSFEAIEQSIPIYEPIRTAIEVEVETPEIELEVRSDS